MYKNCFKKKKTFFVQHFIQILNCKELNIFLQMPILFNYINYYIFPMPKKSGILVVLKILNILQ